MATDLIQRFLFEGTDIRGEYVCLEQAYADVLAPRQDPPAVAALLGEFLAAASLLGSTLKFEGTLGLQASSNGELGTILAETTHDRTVRGIVHSRGKPAGDSLAGLLGEGTLAITIDPHTGQRYQGIVALEDSLAHSLDRYFAQSAQLPTRLWLAADGRRATGLLLQALPEQAVTDPDTRAQQWNHITTLADTVTDAELLGLDRETLLYRLYHQESVRLLDSEPLRFRCSCSQERTSRALLQIGEPEVRSIIAEQGMVEMRCEFCLHNYRFSPLEIDALFAPGGGPVVH